MTKSSSISRVHDLFAAALVFIVLQGCDPRRATAPEERIPSGNGRGIAGMVVNANTDAPIRDAIVEVWGLGTDATDGVGMYYINEGEIDARRSGVVIRAEARGFAPAYRVVTFSVGTPEIPTISLSPLAPTVRVGPQGGSFELASGMILHVPPGAVAIPTPLSVTPLPAITLGPVQIGTELTPQGAIHVGPQGSRFTKPLRISILLAASLPVRSHWNLLRFAGGNGVWVPVGPPFSTVADGYLNVEIPEGDVYLLQAEPDYAARNTAADWVVPIRGGWTTVGECLRPGPVMSGAWPYHTLFWTSVSQTQFPSFYSHLASMYDGWRTVPSSQIATVIEGKFTVEKRPVLEVRTRYGEVWYKADPTHKVAYEYYFTKFLNWETRFTDCDPQGIIEG
jgi:hypothetical protein